METKIPEGLTPTLIAEIKQYVFALYIGQKVYRRHGIEYDNEHVTSDLVHGDLFATDDTFFINSGYLLLRPLSSITENQKIGCIRAHFQKSKLQIWACLKRWRDVELIIDADPGWHFINWLNPCSYQYLQQEGFALDVWYKGRLYTVAELEAMGIFKLQA